MSFAEAKKYYVSYARNYGLEDIAVTEMNYVPKSTHEFVKGTIIPVWLGTFCKHRNQSNSSIHPDMYLTKAMK